MRAPPETLSWVLSSPWGERFSPICTTFCWKSLLRCTLNSTSRGRAAERVSYTVLPDATRFRDPYGTG